MSRNVLVFIPDGIVREDVVQTVKEVLADAHIWAVDTVEAMRDTLAKHQGWAWAVVDAPRADLDDPATRRSFEEHKARPIVLSGPRDGAGADWVFVNQPFDTATLHAALMRTRPD